MNSDLQNISDTAVWVAVQRALASELPNAVIHDPFARHLAGERGFAMAEQIPRTKEGVPRMAVRTRTIDDFVLRCVRAGADTVLNLASGLDSRPFRLDLPHEVRWIDVDLPGILEYKAAKLAGHAPKCRYETVVMDLSQVEKRRELFRRVGSESKNALVIAEGFLVYLTREQVVSLSS